MVEDVYSHHVRSVQFVHLDTNTRHGPYHSLVTSRANVNMLSVMRSPLSEARPGGRWYSPERRESMEAGVMVTSRSVEQRYMVTMWSNVDSLTSNLTHQSPLIVYICLSEGGQDRAGGVQCGCHGPLQCDLVPW